jgi:hypothetical protein
MRRIHTQLVQEELGLRPVRVCQLRPGDEACRVAVQIGDQELVVGIREEAAGCVRIHAMVEEALRGLDALLFARLRPPDLDH